jgi:hypothetical protein
MIPRTPALGLLLEYPMYNGYNAKVIGVNAGLDTSHETYRPPITFDAYEKEMDAFKQKYIYDNMQSVEDRKGLYVLSPSTCKRLHIYLFVILGTMLGCGLWMPIAGTTCCISIPRV